MGCCSSRRRHRACRPQLESAIEEEEEEAEAAAAAAAAAAVPMSLRMRVIAHRSHALACARMHNVCDCQHNDT